MSDWIAFLIPLKAKAWIDLNERKVSGGQVDSKDIRKHKNDVLRLSALLLPDVILDLPDALLKYAGEWAVSCSRLQYA